MKRWIFAVFGLVGLPLFGQVAPCKLDELLSGVESTGTFSCSNGKVNFTVEDNRSTLEWEIKSTGGRIWLSAMEYRSDSLPRVIPQTLDFIQYQQLRFSYEKFEAAKRDALKTAIGSFFIQPPKSQPMQVEDWDPEVETVGYDLFGDQEADVTISVDDRYSVKQVDAWDMECQANPWNCCKWEVIRDDRMAHILQVVPRTYPPNCGAGATKATMIEYVPTAKVKIVGPAPLVVGNPVFQIQCIGMKTVCKWEVQTKSIVPIKALAIDQGTSFEVLGPGKFAGVMPIDQARGNLVLIDQVGRKLEIPIKLPIENSDGYMPCLAIDESSISYQIYCDGSIRKLAVSGKAKAGKIATLQVNAKNAAECITGQGSGFKWVGNWDNGPDVIPFEFRDDNGAAYKYSLLRKEVLAKSSIPVCNNGKEELTLSEVFPKCASDGQAEPRTAAFYDCLRSQFSALIVLNNEPEIEGAEEYVALLDSILKTKYGFSKVEVLIDKPKDVILPALFAFKDQNVQDSSQKLLFWVGHGDTGGELKVGDQRMSKEDVIGIYRKTSSKKVKNVLMVFDVCYGSLDLENLHEVDANLAWTPGSGQYSFSRKLVTSSGLNPAQNMEFTRGLTRVLDQLPAETPWISIDQIMFEIRNQGIAKPFYYFFDDQKVGLNQQGSSFFFYHRSAFKQ